MKPFLCNITALTSVEKTIIQEEPKNSEEMYEFEYDETMEDE